MLNSNEIHWNVEKQCAERSHIEHRNNQIRNSNGINSNFAFCILSNSINADQIKRNEWICPIPYIHMYTHTYVYISLEWQSLSQCHIRHTNSLNYPNIICYVNEFQSIHAQYTTKNKATMNIHTYIEMQKKKKIWKDQKKKPEWNKHLTCASSMNAKEMDCEIHTTVYSIVDWKLARPTNKAIMQLISRCISFILYSENFPTRSFRKRIQEWSFRLLAFQFTIIIIRIGDGISFLVVFSRVFIRK